MKHRFILTLSTAALACVLAALPSPAYIKAPPKTLGSVCLESDHISVLKVEKVDAEKGVIHFKHVEQLKGKHDGTVVKHLIKPDLGDGVERTKGTAGKIILDGAAEGKTAVMFYFTGGNSRGHVYIDGYWYWVGGVSDKPTNTNWVAAGGEPMQLAIYSGTADKLRDAVEKILKGEEVTVPVMSGDNRAELLQRRAKVQEVRASLKIVGADTLARLASRSPEKKPAPIDTKPGNEKLGEKKPEAGEKPAGDKKPEGSQPSLVGTVKALAANGKSFTLLPPPNEKNKEPAAVDIQITERTKITAGKEAGKLAVGQTVSVWVEKGNGKTAAAIQIGKPSEKPTTKPAPGEKPGKPAPNANEKNPDTKREE